MGRMPALTAGEVRAMLHRFGWREEASRGKGGHRAMVKGQDIVYVPAADGRELKRGTTMAILKQAGLEWDPQGGKKRRGGPVPIRKGT